MNHTDELRQTLSAEVAAARRQFVPTSHPDGSRSEVRKAAVGFGEFLKDLLPIVEGHRLRPSPLRSVSGCNCKY
jgi:hypothetical protein